MCYGSRMTEPTTPPLDTTKAGAELYAALAAAQADVASIGKDGTNTQRGYRYATTEAVIRGSRQHLAAHGLAFLSTWAQALPEVAPGDIGKQHVAARVTIHWALGHAAGGQITGTATMDAIGSPARPPDKAVAAAVTYGLGFVLRGLLLLDRADEDEHAPDRRPEPEPDRLWMSYEAARDAAAKHLRITGPQAHQRILHLAEVREDPDMPDADVKRLIGVAEALLLTDPAPTPAAPREPLTPGPDRERAAVKGEQTTEPAKAKPSAVKPKATTSAKAPEPAEPTTEGEPEPKGIAATRAAFQSAYKAYAEECKEQGEAAVAWKALGAKAIGKPWPDRPGTDEYLKAAHACEQAIDQMRGGR